MFAKRLPIEKALSEARIDMYFELQRQDLEQELLKQNSMFDAIFQQAPVGIAISQSSNPFGGGSHALVMMNPMFE